MVYNNSIYNNGVGYLAILFVCLLGSSPCQAVDPPDVWLSKVPDEIAPINAPFDMPQPRRPVFPDRTVKITDFGAVGDGKANNTKAIAAAIKACANEGGGKVVVPPGKWFTGPIHLTSNINLYLSKGSELLFSNRFADYLPVVFTRFEGVECYNYSPFIYAKDCINVAITGPGKLNGQGEPWWPWKGTQQKIADDLISSQFRGIAVKDRIFGIEGGLRPQFIQTINCKNVLFEGFTLTDGPFWSIDPVYCENVIARKLYIYTHHPNGDGVNSDSCKNMLIEYCYFDTDDDAIAIKAGLNEDGWRVNKPSENIVVRHIYSKGPRWGSISIGSEMSGNVRNIYIRDFHFDGTLLGFQIKTMPGRGGVVENVWVEDIKANDLNWCAVYLNTNYQGSTSKPQSQTLPKIRNIHIKNITCSQVSNPNKNPIEINGLTDSLIENVTLENVTCSGRRGLSIKNAKNVKLTNVNMTTRQGPAIAITDSVDITISNSSCPEGVKTFLHVKGSKSKNIQLVDNNLDNTTESVVIDSGAPADAVSIAWDNDKVLGERIFGVEPHDMMKRYLTQKVDQAAINWQKRFESLKTTADIKAYQEKLRSQFRKALGAFPARTPLNPKVTGVLQRLGYRVEKLIYESRPRHYVTAICFVPESEKYKAPYPGVLVPCGHSPNGKAWKDYQTMGALLALNGMVALVFDPIEQGERVQVIDNEGKFKYWGVHAHNRVGVSCALLGQGTATMEMWDGMRGIDYLQLRPDVDPERIGCTGNSGGGTQTSQLMAMEDRIDVAAPSCYITSFERLVHTIGGQDAEQNIYGQLAFGMDHADYITMRAPSPVLIAAGIQDFFDIKGTRTSFRYAQRLFEMLDAADRVTIFENDAPHNYNRQQRQAIATWFAHFLQDRTDEVIEPDIQVFTDKELQCTPRGQVMLIEGARSVYDVNAEQARKLTVLRKQLWQNSSRQQLLSKIRKLAGVRPLQELPQPRIEKGATIKRVGYDIEKIIIYPEEGIALGALHFVPTAVSDKPPVLYLHQQGKHTDAQPAGAIEQLVQAGHIVLAVDLRGSGETQQKGQGYFSPEWGGDGRDLTYAYLFGISYVGMRTEDIFNCARYLKGQEKNVTDGIKMLSVGNPGVPALHAVALEPELFSSVTINNMVTSWTDIVAADFTTNQMVSTIYGGLHVYDLPELAELAADKVTVTNPYNVNEQPVSAKP